MATTTEPHEPQYSATTNDSNTLVTTAVVVVSRENDDNNNTTINDDPKTTRTKIEKQHSVSPSDPNDGTDFCRDSDIHDTIMGRQDEEEEGTTYHPSVLETDNNNSMANF